MIMIKKTLLRSIFLLSFTLLLVSCSKDDDSASTFLERFDNTSWDNGGDYYMKFHNDEVNSVEVWNKSEECYNRYFLASEDNLELITNSENTLILKYTDDNELVTFTVVGETIKIDFEDVDPEILYKSTNSLTASLPICD